MRRGYPVALWYGALALLVMLGALLVPAMARADSSHRVWRLDTTIDRSAVPDWVGHREVTLLMPAPASAKVYAWADGEPLAVAKDPEGLFRVTTAADLVTWAIVGDDLSAEAVGPARLATLRGDKAWAFSLTFDDGERTVATHARPEFDHYGYKAGVAVIGRWLEPEADPNAFGYCSRAEIADLWANGWGVFNHSYHHWNAGSDITVQEAEICQEIVFDTLGVRPVVFTAPFTNDDWLQVIDDNVATLGLHVLQLYADGGERLMYVDDPLVPSDQAAYHMARRDVKLWQDGLYNFVDQAHDHVPQHAWVSLHGHNVAYDEDWYAVADALAYLYTTYGLAGTDEVWVAPVDDVIDYLVTRSTTRLEHAGPMYLSAEQVQGEPSSAPQRLLLRHGSAGQEAWEDTTIHSWYPDQNYAGDAVLTMRGGTGVSALLLKPPLPDLAHADILRATMTIWARSQSHQSDLDLFVMPMTTTWDAGTATWNQASDGQPWTLPGAWEDSGDVAIDTTHSGKTETYVRGYTFDITDQMAEWQRYPETYHGVVVRAGDEVSKQMLFASSQEIMYPAQRPMLAIQYQEPAVPSQLVDPVAVYRLQLPLIAR